MIPADAAATGAVKAALHSSVIAKSAAGIAGTTAAYTPISEAATAQVEKVAMNAARDTVSGAFYQSLGAHTNALYTVGVTVPEPLIPGWLKAEMEKTGRSHAANATYLRSKGLPDTEIKERMRIATHSDLDRLARHAQDAASTAAGNAAKEAGVWEGYRKVPSGSACGWCTVVAAGRLYHTPHIPRHKFDRCGVSIVTTGDGWNPEAETAALDSDYDRIIEEVKAVRQESGSPIQYADMDHLKRFGLGPEPVAPAGGAPKPPNITGSKAAHQPSIPEPAAGGPGGPTGDEWGTPSTYNADRAAGTHRADMNRIFDEQRDAIGETDDWYDHLAMKENPDEYIRQLQAESGLTDAEIAEVDEWEWMQEAEYRAEDEWNEYVFGQMDPQHRAIHRYTAGPYSEINDRMRSGEISRWADEIDDDIRDLSQAITDHGEVTERIYVERGDGIPRAVRANPEQLAGTVISDPAFVSTSAGESGGFSSDVTYRITVNPGTARGLWLEDGAYGLPGENEFLLQRDTRMIVTAVKHEGGKTVVYAETVTDEWATANGFQVDEWTTARHVATA